MVCTNCNFSETTDALYCSSCGQKFSAGKLTVSEFIHDVFDNIFALERNTFLKTLGNLFIPGQLTIDYFNGKRKRYYHPLRMFFVLLVLHLGLISTLIPFDKMLLEITSLTEDIKTKEKLKQQYLAVESLKPSSETRIALDSANKWFHILDTVQNDSLKAKTKFFALQGVTIEDLVLMPFDSLKAKYDIKNYWTGLMLRQVQKFNIDPKGMIKYIIGNVSWMMVILLPFIALFMKILFFRQKRYMIENLFYLYHWHAFAFLVASLTILFFRNNIEAYTWVLMSGIVLFGLIAWYRYYKQGIIKTIIKFCMMGFAYILLFSLLLIITSMVSFGIF